MKKHFTLNYNVSTLDDSVSEGTDPQHVMRDAVALNMSEGEGVKLDICLIEDGHIFYDDGTPVTDSIIIFNKEN